MQTSVEQRELGRRPVGGAALTGEGIAGPAAALPPRSGPSEGAILARESTFRRLLGAADMVAIALSMFVAVDLLGGDLLKPPALAALPLLVLVCKAVGLYDRDESLLHKTTLDELPKLFTIASVGALALFLCEGLVVEGELGRDQVAAEWALLVLLLPTLRSATRAYARGATPAERCLFVGDAASAEEFREKLEGSRSVNAELVGWLPDDDLGRRVDAFDPGRASLAERIRVLISERDAHRIVLGPGPSSCDELLDTVRKIKGRAVKVSVLPDVARVVNSSVELDRLDGITLLGLRQFEISSSSRAIKRCFDCAGSLLALIALAPLFAFAAIAIKLDSRGPVFFAQRRAGRHGTPFRMIKFRTMVDGADRIKDDYRHLNEAAEGLFKIAADPRITRVGRLLRRRHLDELPQLINVLRGDMSLVGPRPLVLDEDRRIEGWHRRRLHLRPGMTGSWQALGASRIPVREMVKLDYQYVADWSLWNDVRILLLTVPVVLRREGL